MRRAVPVIKTTSVEWIAKFALLFALFIWLLKASVVEAFFIPSGSMVPTLEVRDYILVPKFFYGLRIPFMQENLLQWKTPERGDVVVFTRHDDPRTSVDESAGDIVKRVIALPGDEVRISGTSLYLNDSLIDEPYARWAHGADSTFGPIRVPDGQVFLLGDNRDESQDSRFWSYPFVDIHRLKGKAVVVYWSGTDPKRVGTFIH